MHRPRPSVATITRRVARAATAQGWPVPSYGTMHAIVAELDPHLLTLTHDGPVALRDRYELVYRRQAERPNMICRPTTPNSTCSSSTPTAPRPGRG